MIKMMKLRIAPLILAAFTGMALLACAPYVEPVAIPIQPPQLYANAQSTLDSGENQLENLSDQADDLSDQANVVGQEMADAAATQQSITVQNQAASMAEATAQSEAATAAFLSDHLNATQTAQAQVELAARGTLTSQTNATEQAYSLTATTGAALMAAAVQKQDEAEQKARWTTFVVNPVKAVLLALLVLLLIVVGVMFAWRLFQVLEILPRLGLPGDHQHTLLRVDGVIVQPAAAAPPIKQRVLRLLKTSQSPDTPRVEIISPTEPSIVNWITEAEQKLQSGEGMRP
jgi:hypothetical protein